MHARDIMIFVLFVRYDLHLPQNKKNVWLCEEEKIFGKPWNDIIFQEVSKLFEIFQLWEAPLTIYQNMFWAHHGPWEQETCSECLVYFLKPIQASGEVWAEVRTYMGFQRYGQILYRSQLYIGIQGKNTGISRIIKVSRPGIPILPIPIMIIE